MANNLKIMFAAVAVVIAIAFTVGTAVAQLDNKPYSFRNSPGGGPGMSPGGKQAIINEELFNSTPENMLRGPDGRLVDVRKGPGHSAIVFEHGTNASIPGYKGTSFRGDNVLMEAGTFNAYFGPYHDDTSFVVYSNTGQHTALVMNSWLLNIVPPAMQNGYRGPNPVDSWTHFVNNLNRQGFVLTSEAGTAICQTLVDGPYRCLSAVR